MRRLGSEGPETFAIGLGCMAMSGIYGPVEDEESRATICAAREAGITLLDTGDFYGMGHNELLVGHALRSLDRDSIQISVKFGAQRGPDGSWLGYDARPAAVKTALAYSLRRVGVDHVDIYRPARLDPHVPIEETVGAIAEMVAAGYVRYVGLSEVGSDTIRRAHATHPICDVQVEYSLLSRGPERAIIPTCREPGIALTAYGVLSRGLLGGSFAPDQPGDIRRHLPRFRGENLRHNLKLVRRLEDVARSLAATVPELAFAWVLSRGDDIVPLAGARRREHLKDPLGALVRALSAEDLARIEQAVPPGGVEGERYAEAQMSTLDSER